MKLRWVDSKSKRVQEVLIDLDAILRPRGSAKSLCSRTQPVPPGVPSEIASHDMGLDSRPIIPSSSRPTGWQRPL